MAKRSSSSLSLKKGLPIGPPALLSVNTLEAGKADPTRYLVQALSHAGVHPLAIRVIQEIGLDISMHQAKNLDVFRDQPPMDLVVTVCDEAAEACPYFPHARHQVHWGFPDPSRVEGSEEERLAAFRHIRDLIAARLNQFLGLHPASSLEKLYAAAKAQEHLS